jgi:hypothetical protein
VHNHTANMCVCVCVFVCVCVCARQTSAACTSATEFPHLEKGWDVCIVMSISCKIFTQAAKNAPHIG